MDRPDLTNELIHYIRGETLEQAFQILRQILAQSRLLGGTGFIKGGYRCVCFSEAPLAYLGYALLNRPPEVKYQPLGIVVTKPWLYSLGGRPVVYQADNEFSLLPPEIRWRHVRYEPDANPSVDFTWEREWRIQTMALPIGPDVARIVVPTRAVAEALMEEHTREHDSLEQQHALILDQITAWQLREAYPWAFVYIDRL